METYYGDVDKVLKPQVIPAGPDQSTDGDAGSGRSRNGRVWAV